MIMATTLVCRLVRSSLEHRLLLAVCTADAGAAGTLAATGSCWWPQWRRTAYSVSVKRWQPTPWELMR
uniref:Putative secreted peptide n=1 Tax=Anopheles braziliensis TaxID=58242 RepID=A0A2M3ZUD1_9DIPT